MMKGNKNKFHWRKIKTRGVRDRGESRKIVTASEKVGRRVMLCALVY